jgi:hypothetical protein
MREAGWTTRDLRHAEWLHDLHDALGEDGWKRFEGEFFRLQNKTEHAQRRAAAPASFNDSEG